MYTKKDKAKNLRYVEAAKRLFHEEGSIEIDDNAKVSKGDANGAYVEAWVWVSNDELKPVKTYTVKKLFGVWRVITPSGNAVVVGHKTQREANIVAKVFNFNKRDEKTVVAISLSALEARAGLISESDEN
jgi:hypothetical protein